MHRKNKPSKVFDFIREEEERQKNSLMMIASENYAHPEVRAAVGSVLMHKYSEGQIGKRYYQGNQVVDKIEKYCKELTLDVFGLPEEDWGVNVQAHSGSPANLAVFNALLKPGDKILSMYLPEGGHLSHGWYTGLKKITLVSKLYDVHFYNVDPKTLKIDYEKLRQIARKIKPKIIVSGGTAYPFEVVHKRMRGIAEEVGAYYLADVAHEAGLMAVRAIKTPFPYVDVVTFTTHKTLRGPRGAVIISRKAISKKIDASVFPGIQGGPHNHTIAGIAVALEKSKEYSFRSYASQVINNAQKMTIRLRKNGFKVLGRPEKHLLLIDLKNKNINGAFFARALEHIGIIVNKNTIVNDTGSPMYPTGIRIGLQALTVRGMKGRQLTRIAWIMGQVADKIVEKLGNMEADRDPGIRDMQWERLEEHLATDEFYPRKIVQVQRLCDDFPIEF